jgi:hypothetical protein
MFSPLYGAGKSTVTRSAAVIAHSCLHVQGVQFLLEFLRHYKCAMWPAIAGTAALVHSVCKVLQVVHLQIDRHLVPPEQLIVRMSSVPISSELGLPCTTFHIIALPFRPSTFGGSRSRSRLTEYDSPQPVPLAAVVACSQTDTRTPCIYGTFLTRRLASIVHTR